MILDIHFAQWNVSWPHYILSRKENLEKFHSYSDTISNMQINEEFTTGSNDIYDVATQNKKFLHWPIIYKLNSKKDFIKVYATRDHAASVKTQSYRNFNVTSYYSTRESKSSKRLYI